jgi:hypothetical protein
MRTRYLIALAVITPLGFASKAYAGPVDWWVQDYLGGVLYEMLWVLIAIAIRPRWSPWRVAAGVLAVTSALEFLQLWHPPALEAIRETFIGSTLLGTTFVWWDFPHYVIGCLLGALLASWLGRADISGSLGWRAE